MVYFTPRPTLHLNHGVLIELNFPLLLLEVLVDIVQDGASLQHKPALNPVPQNNSFFPHVALEKERNGNQGAVQQFGLGGGRGEREVGEQIVGED